MVSLNTHNIHFQCSKDPSYLGGSFENTPHMILEQ